MRSSPNPPTNGPSKAMSSIALQAHPKLRVASTRLENHPACHCMRASEVLETFRCPPQKNVHRSALFCVTICGREFSRRAQKISPAQAGPSQREETPPVQGQFQDTRVGCACYGQLKLAPPCDFWDTVFKRGVRCIAVMVF